MYQNAFSVITHCPHCFFRFNRPLSLPVYSAYGCTISLTSDVHVTDRLMIAATLLIPPAERCADDTANVINAGISGVLVALIACWIKNQTLPNCGGNSGVQVLSVEPIFCRNAIRFSYRLIVLVKYACYSAQAGET